MKKAFKIVLLLLLPLLSACRRQVRITTNTFADAQAIPGGFEEGSSFAILPAEKDKNQLFNKEIASKITRELRAEGYEVKPVKEAEKADYCLVFGYGITSSTNTINVAKYVPGETQIKRGFVAGRRDEIDYEEVTETSGTTVYVPEERTVFKRELMMQVYDSKIYHKDKQEELVWQGSAVSYGDCSDLRLIIDYLIGALFNHFGEDTGMNLRSSVDLDFDGIGQNF